MATDRELVARCIGGEEAAFREMYAAHTPPLYAFIRRVLGRHAAEADDVLQDVWLRAMRDLRRFAWASTLRTWIFGIALNRCREVVRFATREPPADDLWDEGVERPRAGDRVDLERALAALSIRYREVLLLHDLYEYTHEEIATLLGIEAGTSKSNLARGRRAMRALIEGESKVNHA